MFFDFIAKNRSGKVVWTECIEASDRATAMFECAEIVKHNPLLKVATWTLSDGYTSDSVLNLEATK